jgi:2-keto-4-pentenoate hydratase/2-oxohepta-3-ene-1,7-dioic acid hydratase in catechol pathway
VKIARFSTEGDPRYGIVDGDDLVVLSGDPMFSGFDTTGERVPLDGVKLLAPVIPRSKVVCVGLNYAESTTPVETNPSDSGSSNSSDSGSSNSSDSDSDSDSSDSGSSDSGSSNSDTSGDGSASDASDSSNASDATSSDSSNAFTSDSAVSASDAGSKSADKNAGQVDVDDALASGPSTPLLFLKPNTAIVGPGDTIQIPPVEGRVVHEGELAIVIGRVAKQVKAADYADYVFGYTIANDVSARDVMFSDGQWARAKGYDTFCPIGPVIETELDISALEIQTYVDGEPRRNGNTRDMIHSIPEIIEFASDVWTLLPGDIILTGTPAGLGGFVDGQTIDITIEGIGTLSNPARNRA